MIEEEDPEKILRHSQFAQKKLVARAMVFKKLKKNEKRLATCIFFRKFAPDY